MEHTKNNRKILWIILGVLVLAALLYLFIARSQQAAAPGSGSVENIAPPTEVSAAAAGEQPAAAESSATPEEGPAAGSSAQEPTQASESPARNTPTASALDYRIVTLLPKDAIPSIDSPRFFTAAEADAEYDPDELVLGVTINGESKAYSSSFLDSHEIVNDTLGGRPISVTW